jgi:hypothetical protein
MMLTTGTKLGTYEIIGLIGAGGPPSSASGGLRRVGRHK